MIFGWVSKNLTMEFVIFWFFAVLSRGAAAQSLKTAIFGPSGTRKTGKNQNFKNPNDKFLDTHPKIIHTNFCIYFKNGYFFTLKFPLWFI